MKFIENYIALAVTILVVYFLLRREVASNADKISDFFSPGENPVRAEAGRVINSLSESEAIKTKADTEKIILSAGRIWSLLDNTSPVAWIRNKMNANRDNDLFNEVAQLDNDELRAVTLRIGKKSIIYPETNLGLMPVTLPQMLIFYFKNHPTFLNAIKQRLKAAKLTN